MIGVIDYGAGNLSSVVNAFKELGKEVQVMDNPKQFTSADKLVFPGVGAFGAMMDSLKENKLVNPLKEFLGSGKPFLGICLGLQALFEESEESRGVNGLAWFKGKCKRFSGVKVPQMGWNQIKVKKNSRLFKGIPDKSFVFFANSFYVKPLDESIVSAETNYRVNFCSAIGSGNIFAVQFHPEKSGVVGLKILKNFLEM